MNKVWMIGLVALFATFALLSASLAGCAGGAKTLPADEATAFANQVDAITENLLVSLSNHHYATYTQDMDATMKAASSEAQFEQVYATVIGKIGRYVSRQMTRVIEQKPFRTVVYDAQFEQEEHVTVQVVYNVEGDRPLVSGLWFDSPKLRQQ